ncbi:hypothetical protein CC79DRAFT_1351963 [Sarocladium strictum]
MERPVKEIPGVIAALTTGEPAEQEKALNTYFLPNASFSQLNSRIPNLSKSPTPIASGVDSLWVILAVYRWYRTLSPHIDIIVDSSVFDEKSGLLYVSLRQTFALWFIPLYKAPVRLVSVLQLTQCNIEEMSWQVGENDSPPPVKKRPRPKYFIASQEDLYPVTDCLQLLLPGLGPTLLFFWHLYSAWLCIMGSMVLLPLYLVFKKRPKRRISWMRKA